MQTEKVPAYAFGDLLEVLFRHKWVVFVALTNIAILKISHCVFSVSYCLVYKKNVIFTLFALIISIIIIPRELINIYM